MKTTKPELEVPAAATDALHNQWPYAPAAEAVRAIATPVVVAWARARAAEYDGMGTGIAGRVFSDVAADLRGWADELKAGA